VGEVRAGSLGFAQRLEYGHGTSVSTIHADTPLGALLRLGMLCGKAGVEVDHELIGSTVNVIATMERIRGQLLARGASWRGAGLGWAALCAGGRSLRGESSLRCGAQSTSRRNSNQGHGACARLCPLTERRFLCDHDGDDR